jgi:carboxylesterase type B
MSKEIGAGLLKYLGCSPSDLACAQGKTTIQIRTAEHNATRDVILTPGNEWLMGAGGPYRPSIDGSFVPGDFADLVRTGQYNRKANILWGSTRDEAALFLSIVFPGPIPLDQKDKELAKYLFEDRTKALFTSPFYALNESDPDTIRNELSRAVTDLLWACGTQRMSRGTAAHDSKVYTYRLDHGRDTFSAFGLPAPPFCQGRVCHGDDLVPSFGSGDVLQGIVQTGSDARFARQVIDRFTTFAKTGSPNVPTKGAAFLGLASQNEDVTGVTWPAYDRSSDRVFVLGLEKSYVEVGEDTDRCRWIEEHVKYDYQAHSPSGKDVPIFP